MSEWIYQGKPVSEIPEFDEISKNNQGFVYRITYLKNNKYYVGKKFFVSKVCKKPLKGRVNKRRSLKESDWMSYYGSSPEVQKILAEEGPNAFRREILVLCKTKFETAYREAEMQFQMGVLFDPMSYNQVVNVRLRKAK